MDLLYGPYEWPWSDLTSDPNGGVHNANPILGRKVKVTALENVGVGEPISFRGLRTLRCVLCTSLWIGTPSIRWRSSLPVVERSPEDWTRRSYPALCLRPPQKDADPPGTRFVIYSSNSHDGMDVYQRTDAEGRYRFWNLPVGPLGTCWRTAREQGRPRRILAMSRSTSMSVATRFRTSTVRRSGHAGWPQMLPSGFQTNDVSSVGPGGQGSPLGARRHPFLSPRLVGLGSHLQA